jgi:hypothetical protein
MDATRHLMAGTMGGHFEMPIRAVSSIFITLYRMSFFIGPTNDTGDC